MAQQCGRPGFDPWVGKILWRRERLPTPVLWPGEFHGLYSPWCCRVGHDWMTVNVSGPNPAFLTKLHPFLCPSGLLASLTLKITHHECFSQDRYEITGEGNQASSSSYPRRHYSESCAVVSWNSAVCSWNSLKQSALQRPRVCAHKGSGQAAPPALLVCDLEHVSSGKRGTLLPPFP